MIFFEKFDFRHNLRQKLFPQFPQIIFDIKEINLSLSLWYNKSRN